MRISDWSSDVCSSDLVTITARPEESPSIWMIMLYNSLPFLLFLGIAFFVLRQMQKNSGSGAMGFAKRRARMLTQKRSEERRVGNECVSTCRSRWVPNH